MLAETSIVVLAIVFFNLLLTALTLAKIILSENRSKTSAIFFAVILCIDIVYECMHVAYVAVCSNKPDMESETASTCVPLYSIMTVSGYFGAIVFTFAVLYRYQRLLSIFSGSAWHYGLNFIRLWTTFTGIACSVLFPLTTVFRYQKRPLESLELVYKIAIFAFNVVVVLSDLILMIRMVYYVSKTTMSYAKAKAAFRFRFKLWSLVSLIILFDVGVTIDNATVKLFDSSLNIIAVYISLSILEIIRQWLEIADKQSEPSEPTGLDKYNSSSESNPYQISTINPISTFRLDMENHKNEESS